MMKFLAFVRGVMEGFRDALLRSETDQSGVGDEVTIAVVGPDGVERERKRTQPAVDMTIQ